MAPSGLRLGLVLQPAVVGLGLGWESEGHLAHPACPLSPISLPPPPPHLFVLPPHLCPGQVFCSWTYITSEQVQGRLSLPLFCQGEDAVGEEEGDEEGSLHGPRAVNEPLPGALLTMTVEAQSMAMVELQLSSPSVGDAAAVQINAQVRRGAFPRLHFPPLPPPCCLSLLPTAPPPNLHNREYSHTVLGGGPL